MFYQNVIELCRQHHVSPSAMAKELGLSNNAPTKWKTGSTPRSDTIQKVADYFDVSVDHLLSDNTANNIGHHNGAVSNSAVVQGATAGGSMTVSNGAEPATLSEQEEELLRVFRALSARRKNTAMNRLYELEDEEKAENKE